jgi:hypothetical protein
MCCPILTQADEAYNSSANIPEGYEVFQTAFVFGDDYNAG